MSKSENLIIKILVANKSAYVESKKIKSNQIKITKNFSSEFTGFKAFEPGSATVITSGIENTDRIRSAPAANTNRNLLDFINRIYLPDILTQLGVLARSNSAVNNIIENIVDFDPLIESFENIVDGIQSKVDYMNFYRKTFKKYRDNEKTRTIGQ
jgi:hypothetical protein